MPWTGLNRVATKPNEQRRSEAEIRLGGGVYVALRAICHKFQASVL
jgi:hypothetical protein